MTNRSHPARTLLAACALACLGASACSGRKDIPTPQDVGATDTGADVMKAAAIIRDAQRLEVAGKDREAMVQYKNAIETYHDLPVAWNNLGRLLMKSGENLAAADAFKTAAELSPTDPRPMYNLGALWEDLGYLDDAERWYEQALTREPRHLPSLRRAILVDELRDVNRQVTADRIQTALLLEREPWWIDRFKRYQIRLRQALINTGATSEGTAFDAVPRPRSSGQGQSPGAIPQSMPQAPAVPSAVPEPGIGQPQNPAPGAPQGEPPPRPLPE